MGSNPSKDAQFKAVSSPLEPRKGSKPSQTHCKACNEPLYGYYGNRAIWGKKPPKHQRCK